MDIRTKAAQYYDLNPEVPKDIPFYRGQIPSPDARVLELGCGTGRVLVALVDSCGYIHGLDVSETMLSICRKKLKDVGIPISKAQVEVGNISSFNLGRKFDLVIAPYRVFQNLETDSQVDGLFDCVRKHLSPSGTCILNVFNPKSDVEGMRREWCVPGETFCWEVPIPGGRVTCHDRRAKIDKEKTILYPELIYRRYEGRVLRDEVVMKIVMRCYYPKQFKKVINDHGFDTVKVWGGYGSEPYGEGSELVIQFAQGSRKK